MRGRYEQKSPSKIKLNFKIITIIFIFIVVLLILIFWGFVYKSINTINKVTVPEIQYTQNTDSTNPITEDYTINKIIATSETGAHETESYIPTSKDYMNFLIVGQASRYGETERFADTMILCTFNIYEKTLRMTSMLRDSFVKMPNYKGHTGGRIKLTTIYHLGSTYGDGIAGSMELMNMTLFNNFGIEVDHNFEIDFDAFIQVIDILGGVEIELTQAEADYLNADDFWVYEDVEPGMTTLNGMTALCYARMRKAAGDGDSDITRTSRQRKLIEALLDKLKNLSLSDLQYLIETVLPLITTSMDNSEITSCLFTLLPMLPELTILEGGTCPENYSGDYVDIYSNGTLHSVLRFSEAETKSAMRAITEGEVD